MSFALDAVKFSRLCWTLSRRQQNRFICISAALLKSQQNENNTCSHVNNKERSSYVDEGKELSVASTLKPPVLFALTAKWKWVVRGKYKVAAFYANNNPATRLDAGQYRHSHKCPNCSAVYEHSHLYGSLHHPQYVRDCPNCKASAPSDIKIGTI